MLELSFKMVAFLNHYQNTTTVSEMWVDSVYSQDWIMNESATECTVDRKANHICKKKLGWVDYSSFKL